MRPEHYLMGFNIVAVGTTGRYFYVTTLWPYGTLQYLMRLVCGVN